jgi:hypothetical protein
MPSRHAIRRLGSHDRGTRAAHLTWEAWSLYRRGRLASAISRAMEAREFVDDPAIEASLDRLEQLSRARQGALRTSRR